MTAQCGGGRGGWRPRRAMRAPAGRPSALTLSTGRWRHTPRFRGARLPPTSDGSTADRLAVNRRFPRPLRTVGQCAGAACRTREARSRTSLRFISQMRRCVGRCPGDFGVRHSGGKWSGSLNPEPCPFGFMGLSLPRWGRLAPLAPGVPPAGLPRGWGGWERRGGAGRQPLPRELSTSLLAEATNNSHHLGSSGAVRSSVPETRRVVDHRASVGLPRLTAP